jgi:hypothetical protein
MIGGDDGIHPPKKDDYKSIKELIEFLQENHKIDFSPTEERAVFVCESALQCLMIRDQLPRRRSRGVTHHSSCKRVKDGSVREGTKPVKAGNIKVDILSAARMGVLVFRDKACHCQRSLQLLIRALPTNLLPHLHLNQEELDKFLDTDDEGSGDDEVE